MYKGLELEMYSIKTPVNLPKGTYIEKPPKGAEVLGTPVCRAYRSDPTEYKSSFVNPVTVKIPEI